MNLGYRFYRDEYRKSIIEDSRNLNLHTELFELKDSFKITFKTTYPGLTIGLGYENPAVEDDDFKLGFFFDFTTGLPYIPASSLKGVLRSVFPLNENEKEKIEFINYALGDKPLTYKEIKNIEYSIFGKRNGDKDIKDNLNTKDTFLDSYVSKTTKLLEDDSLAPHGDNPLKNPIPLKFLKIAPNCEITFQFILSDSNKLISKKQRLNLYKNILEYIGIGAKTNVGYGQLEYSKFYFKDFSGKSIDTLFEEMNKIKEEQEKREKLKTLSPVDKIIFEAENDTTKIIQAMQNGEIENFEEIKIELAIKLKSLMQKDPKLWEKVKQKALKRKEYIEGILGKN